MYLLFDIGGTKMRLAISRDGRQLIHQKIFKTPKNFEAGIKIFERFKTETLNLGKIKLVCGGVAGTFNKDKSRIFSSPHLKKWQDKPLKRELENLFGKKVFIENDADLAGLGEAIYGAGKGYNIVVYLTISTGVGGTRIVNGSFDENTFGFDPGHQIIDIRNHLDLEDIVSGSAILKKYKKEPYEIKSSKFWDQKAQELGVGLHNIALLWSPEVIVLGGSMMKKIGIPIRRVRIHFKRILKLFPRIPAIVKSSLGEWSAIYGGLACLKKKS